MFDQVLNAMGSLQSSEVSLMEGLMATAQDNGETLSEAESMEPAKLAKKQKSYAKRRKDYLEKCLGEEVPDHLVVKNVLAQKELMTKVTILKIAEEKSKDSKVINDDVAVLVASELATRQKLEMKHFEAELEGIEDEILLKELIKVLKRARNEFWSLNITSTLLYPPVSAGDGKAIGQEWIRLAKVSLRENIGEKIMEKKIGEKRRDRRKEENISSRPAFYTEKTVVDVTVTAEEQNQYIQKIKGVGYIDVMNLRLKVLFRILRGHTLSKSRNDRATRRDCRTD